MQTIGSNSCSAAVSASFSCQQAYFSRAFDIYTRLWKYQQTHRNILDKKYGLKRWQIGDIASKIGQLYYHYYLRTSELAYLVEAANFYGAIRGRGYYARTPTSRRDSGTATSARSCRSTNTENSASGDSVLIVKKLRYYARFIIVSLLLRRNNVKELLRVRHTLIWAYTFTQFYFAFFVSFKLFQLTSLENCRNCQVTWKITLQRWTRSQKSN